MCAGVMGAWEVGRRWGGRGGCGEQGEKAGEVFLFLVSPAGVPGVRR